MKYPFVFLFLICLLTLTLIAIITSNVWLGIICFIAFVISYTYIRHTDL